MSSKSHLWVFCILFSLLVLLTLCFTYFISPYQIFFRERIQQYSDSKHEVVYFLAEDFNPEIIQFGDSRVGYTDTDYLSRLTQKDVFNFSLPSSSIEEIEYLIHHLDEFPDVQQIFIGLSFYPFLSSFSPPGNLSYYHKLFYEENLHYKDFIRRYFSIESVKKSAKLLRSVMEGNDYTHNKYNADGSKSYDDSISDERFRNKWNWTLGSYRKTYRPGSVMNTGRLKQFQQIVEECQAKNFELYTYISPIHIELFQIIQENGLEDTYNEWLQEIKQICPNVMTFNSFTSEKKNFIDPSHLKVELSQQIFTELLHQSPLPLKDLAMTNQGNTE
ncbi:MAG: DUF1574 domain-containing protein [Spirochaetales bacterium]|nr:DUF1574 domain-containing protein [Spirochaetales bacterium]